MSTPLIKHMLNKIIVILGPTSSGKSDLAIDLAKKFGGEIISADSRQVYRGLDIGAGKITKKEMKGIRHWMIDVVNPKTDYNVAKFKKAVDKIIPQILERGRMPIICGGTGFWIKAIVDNVNFPAVKPDWKLRQKLGKKSANQLFNELKKLDPTRAATIDRFNKIRLIRAIEIVKTLGRVPKLNLQFPIPNFQFVLIGIKVPKEKLHQRIKIRLYKRFGQGMIKEVKSLHFKKGLSWKKIKSFGLGYYWIPEYLQNKLTKPELFDKVYQAEKDYAKRQTTWWKKDPRIIWLDNDKKIETEVKKFLRQ